MTDDADEDLMMRATVIGEQHYDDDYQIIWRGHVHRTHQTRERAST